MTVYVVLDEVPCDSRQYVVNVYSTEEEAKRIASLGKYREVAEVEVDGPIRGF